MFLKSIILATTALFLTTAFAENVETVNSISGRVLGGQKTDAQHCPWLALIATEVYSHPGTSGYTTRHWVYSTGSLLSPSWVITQAEPLREGLRSILTLGSSGYFKFDEENAEIAKAYPENYRFHPNSRPGNELHNLALIKLDCPLRLRFPNVIAPVFPLRDNSPETYRRLQHLTCKICGFGTNCKFISMFRRDPQYVTNVERNI